MGERYSRESYDEAEAKHEEAEDSAAGARHGVTHQGREYPDTEAGRTAFMKLRRGEARKLESRAAAAQKRVERLYGKATKEATELNEEHERLIRGVEEAQNALVEANRRLDEFEKEKLGMHQSVEEQTESTEKG